MEDLLRHVEGVCALLRSMSGAACFKEASQAQRKLIVYRVGALASLSPADAGILAAAATNVPWDASDRELLLKSIAEKSAMVHAGAVTHERMKLQNYEAITNYVDNKTWDDMRNDPASAMSIMGTLACQLGLRHPTETTLQVLTALLLLHTDYPHV